MQSLLTQLTAAANHAVQEAEYQERRRWGPAGRPAPREKRPPCKGLNDAIRSRLPATSEAAVSLPEIRMLLADLEYSESGLSGALSWMRQQGEVQRVGEHGHYRYYRLKVKG